MIASRALAVCLLLLLATAGSASNPDDGSARPGLIVQAVGSSHALGFSGSPPFHTTADPIVEDRLIELPNSPLRVAVWSEVGPGGRVAPFYGISLDGTTMATVRRTRYVMQLRHGEFDPAEGQPEVQAALAASPESNLYLVQFVTQPLEEYRETIRNLGGKVQQFIAGHTHFVRMPRAVRDQVAALPFVRWVGPVHRAYKLEEEIKAQILSQAEIDPRRYSIMLHERGVPAQDRVVAEIEALGGEVHGTTPQGFRIEATLSLDQVREIAALDDVMFIDRKGEMEIDLDIVRQTGGADYLETVEGFTGQGVRAEVADTELDVTHPEWSAPPIIHVAGSGVAHGTSVYGILFAQGVNAQARGIIPDGVGIFAQSNSLLGGGPTRYTHTAELVDPVGPYRTVLQTNSTGDPRTFFYTTISAEMDDILFINDILITQSQSNAGNQDSRPQAWAKNIVSGGAVDHFNTLTPTDDCWSCGSGSIGPADDGRIKPDLCFFYDLTLSASAGGGYTEFGGTSGATPSIAGYFGLFFQMWSEQVFGNDVPNPGGTVFENRPHMTTAKAVMINTATQYPFTGQAHDLTRVHQGWGVPSVQSLYDIRNKIGIIDETEVLANLETREFLAFVDPGEPALRVTMTFADPMGSPAASEARINDLTLKVTSPSSTVYWGNNGLLDGNWSVSGGVANTVDTVENVFVENPEAGLWTVEVIASEVNQDSHLETPAVDADFALVVSGAALTNCSSEGRIQLDRTLYACNDTASIRVVDCDLNLSDTVVDTVSVTIDSGTEPGGETVLLTETAETTADFRGTIPMSLVDAAGVLHVADADTVTATYTDADDGMGGTNVVVQDTATMDCAPPVISNVQAINVTGDRASITWDTDEPADGLATYGDSQPPTLMEAETAGLVTGHNVDLTGLDECTVYSFEVSSTDEAGNAATDDNLGSYYSFSTGVNNEPEYPSTDTPIPILDNTTFNSVIAVADSDTVLDVDVKLNITHTYDGDLDIFLVGPNAVRVELTSDNGGTGENFTDTIFDDEAATSITTGSAPFTGSYQPEGSLATLDGIPANGNWTLEVTDDAGVDQGTLVDWTLILTFQAQACGASGQFVSHQLETDACSTGSAGLGNNRWEVGEVVQFSMTVKNGGTEPMSGVTAQVTPLGAGIAMLDDTATVGGLVPGAQSNTQPPHFLAHLTAPLQCGDMMDFQVDIISNEGSWSDTMQQEVGELIAERTGTTLTEDFTGGIPAGWTIVDGSSDSETWHTDNSTDPALCGNPDPAAPIAGDWAAVDSDCAGGGTIMDEQLISPVLGLVDAPVVTLEFDHWLSWNPQQRDEVADIDVRSSLTGGAWVNVASFTGASTTNPQHETIDVSAQLANTTDGEVRWRYHNAKSDDWWYVDNINLHWLDPEVCHDEVCAPNGSIPPPVPDGGPGSTPVTVDRLTLDASELSIAWDNQCTPANAKIVYGDLAQVSSHTISGSVCGVGSPETWTSVPAADLWFLLIGSDGAGVESSWGLETAGERFGLSPSDTCGDTVKEILGTCP